MRALRLTVGIGCVLAVMAASPPSASAQLTAEQAKCLKTIGQQGRKLFKKVTKTLQKCEDKVAKGKLPAGTDCQTETKTADKIANIKTKVTEKIAKLCTDADIAALTFSGPCAGKTTVADLTSCLIQTHEEEALSAIDFVYGRVNPSSPLAQNTAKCVKMVAKQALKAADKRLVKLQKCRNNVASGKLPPATDCWEQVKTAEAIAKAFDKAVAKIADKCSQTDFQSILLGAPCDRLVSPAGANSASSCAVCRYSHAADDLLAIEFGVTAAGLTTGTAVAKQITSDAECVDGPLSRCKTGDFLLANDRIRVVIQGVQRNLFGIGQFGGQIIDADLVRTGGDPDRDSFEEMSVQLNIENTAHYTSVTVLNDGSDGNAAVIRATGPDDLLDFVNASSVVASFGFSPPAGTDDTDLPVDVRTDYILEPGADYVRIETTIQNNSSSSVSFFFGEYLNGSGQVELFQPGYGFGEALVTTGCDNCDFVAYSGEDEADGVAYGYIYPVPGSSTFTAAGVTVSLLGAPVTTVLAGLTGPNFTIAPMGQPGDSITLTRYFSVGKSVASIVESRNEIRCIFPGTIRGTVTVNGTPVEGADVVVLQTSGSKPSGITRNVAVHTRTDASGNYSVELPPGDYAVMANLDGHPFEGGGSTPTQHAVTLASFATETVDIDLPETGQLQVAVTDPTAGGAPVPAKVSVVGFDPSPDPGNTQSILSGFIVNNTGVFGDLVEDGMPFGIAKAFFVDPLSGTAGPLDIEPGSYRVAVSRGPAYSLYEQDVTITAGNTTTVNAAVQQVVDMTGLIPSDFHVHSIDSPDSEVTREERVISMLGEGMQFFTPSDHDFRADFTGTISDLGVGSLIKTATSAEITTFDYGHFNAWPVAVDSGQVNGGSVDHGRAAPDGQDFPSFGNYSLTPEEIILAATTGTAGATTVQINHLHSHFGIDGGSGLAIDTALTPPSSAVPGAARRLDPAVTNYFSDLFDGLEIWIGDDRGQIFDKFLGQNIGDWVNLINQGIIGTGVADSDTHRRFLTQAGIPRTLVASLESDPSLLDPATLSADVNAGRAIGTNAPVVRVTAYAPSTGESGALEKGRCTDGVTACTDVLSCPPCLNDAQCVALKGAGYTCQTLPTTIDTGGSGNSVTITVDIESPPWAEFDTVELYVNGPTTQWVISNVETGAGAVNVNRYAIAACSGGTSAGEGCDSDDDCPGGGTCVPNASQTHVAGVDFTISKDGPDMTPGTADDVWVAQTSFTITPTSDSWFFVLVKGTDGTSKPLFPVVPNDLDQTSNTTLADLIDGNLGEDGVTALAFTNPIFLDVDGGGWTPPGVQLTP